MCVVNKQFGLPKFVFNSIYVDLKLRIMRFSLFYYIGSVCLCGVCSHVVFLSMSVLITYVVGAVTVMCVLLLVLDVSMLREYDGDSDAGVGDGGCVVAMSAEHSYV